MFEKSKKISNSINDLSDKQKIIKSKLDNILSTIPNIALKDVPIGKDENSNKSYIKSKDIKKISTNNIKKMLENSLQNEDYEMAARLRDELNSRKSIK